MEILCFHPTGYVFLVPTKSKSRMDSGLTLGLWPMLFLMVIHVLKVL